MTRWLRGSAAWAALFAAGIPACTTPPSGDRGPGITAASGPEARPVTRPTRPRIVDFSPGIRIDYRIPQVEIAGEIILREGPLELFAYALAPVPKQHESIVLLRSKPQRIYQALGLTGLTPGKTARYFPETRETRPSSGDPVDVFVRYAVGERERTVSAGDWMRSPGSGQAMPPRHWVFTGSDRLNDGTFYADVEGTVVTVVDFPSSLVSLPERHSDSNDELWLEANTPAIPPVGTKVTLVLRSVPRVLTIELSRDGRVLLDGVPTPAADLTDVLKRRTAGWTDRAKVQLDVAPGLGRQRAEDAVRAIEAAGIRRDDIKGAAHGP
ncbi:MAG: YdjY domain-containing protein [Phycisphaerae bacterium]